MRALLSLVAPLALASCFPWSTLPNDRPDPVLRKLSEAKILDMNPNLYKQPGLCPGMEGKLYVTATVQWPGSKPVSRTLGSDVDSLSPADFEVSGPLIKGDANAHLYPDPDVLASVERGFETTIVYKPNPQFSFHEKFPPEYSCYYGWFADGGGGGGGNGGEQGDSTSDEGKNGGGGGQGGQGGRGDSGGHIVAYVTVVSTPFYPRVLAVLANNHFFLAPADRALGFGAAGGPGGSGGAGGSGGNGGPQKTKDVKKYDDNGNESTVVTGVGTGGNGGDGGAGGAGGPGGNGGTVEVYYDQSYPELAQLIATDVQGGAPGGGGNGGYGGSAGGTNAAEEADAGANGAGGPNGPDGSVAGSPGRASVRPASVASRFRGLKGITLLSEGGATPPKKRRGR